MKRKRRQKTHLHQHPSKRLKCDDASPPFDALLKKYYPTVITLRQFLVSRLSKKRARKLHQYDNDGAVVELLDTTSIGVFRRVEVENTSFVDEDINIYTQQLSDSESSLVLTPGAFKQPEIVDFAIWLLFRQHHGARPKHLLCHNFQKYLTESTYDREPQIMPGIPGIYSCGKNENADLLRRYPWNMLPDLLGKGAERILVDLLVECGIFVPVGKSGNATQISGLPMCDLEMVKPTSAVSDRRGERRTVGQVTNAPHRCGKQSLQRGLSDIRFVRHRMMYSRTTLNARGIVRFGLGPTHVLNRMKHLDARKETIHVMKYIFPKQFGLHNVLTSAIDPKDTAQPFRDYTLREQEIICQNRKTMKVDPGGNHVARMKQKAIPKRLRGVAESLVHQIRVRHSTCSYSLLLDYYCPRSEKAGDIQEPIRQATNAAQVSAFCRAALSKVFPKSIWGANTRILHRNVDKFIRLRRFESLSLHDVLQSMRTDNLEWLAPPCAHKGENLSLTDFGKRKELMAELLYYVFDSYLIPLIRAHFHVTESNVHRNQIFYFRHDTWNEMSEPVLASLKQNMLEECNATTVKTILSRRSLGVSYVRLLPKAHGMRPIINLRRRTQKLQGGRLVLGRSINSILTPAFSALNCEKASNPSRLGSALFSVDEIFPRLQRYRQVLAQRGLLGKRLYFAKVDVQACFDSIPQEHLLQLADQILRTDRYRIARYSRGKLAGGHESEATDFGAKPSWKFLTTASADADEFSIRKQIESDTRDGRTRSVYVNGVAQRSESRMAVLDMLHEHVGRNLIKVGKHFYRQKEGIPQGSIMSSILCSYFYAKLEAQVLDFVHDGKSVLLRLIDDFLLISTERDVPIRFLETMHAGVPAFGVKVKAEKSRANFDVQVDGKLIAKLPENEPFPYCGTAIDSLTLDLSKDRERRRQSNLANTVTVEYSRLPGQSFYRKMLNAFKLQVRAMLFSTAYNSVETAVANIHHAFSEVALKSYHYVKALTPAMQPSNKLIIRTVEDMIKMASALMRRGKKTSRDILPYECCISNVQIRWLAYSAFATVFRRRQTKFGGLVEHVEQGMLRARLTGVERRVLENAAIGR